MVGSNTAKIYSYMEHSYRPTTTHIALHFVLLSARLVHLSGPRRTPGAGSLLLLLATGRPNLTGTLEKAAPSWVTWGLSLRTTMTSAVC